MSSRNGEISRFILAWPSWTRPGSGLAWARGPDLGREYLLRSSCRAWPGLTGFGLCPDPGAHAGPPWAFPWLPRRSWGCTGSTALTGPTVPTVLWITLGKCGKVRERCWCFEAGLALSGRPAGLTGFIVPHSSSWAWPSLGRARALVRTLLVFRGRPGPFGPAGRSHRSHRFHSCGRFRARLPSLLVLRGCFLNSG